MAYIEMKARLLRRRLSAAREAFTRSEPAPDFWSQQQAGELAYLRDAYERLQSKWYRVLGSVRWTGAEWKVRCCCEKLGAAKKSSGHCVDCPVEILSEAAKLNAALDNHGVSSKAP